MRPLRNPHLCHIGLNFVNLMCQVVEKYLADITLFYHFERQIWKIEENLKYKIVHLTPLNKHASHVELNKISM